MPPHTGIVLSSLAFLYWIVQSASFPPHDFSNSYFGARYLLEGTFDAGIYDPYTFNARIYADGFHNIFASYNPNPPSASIFFIPLSWLPIITAKIVFNVLSSFLFITTILRLCRHFRLNDNLILTALPVLFFVPVRNQILFGQTYFLLFWLLGEGYLAWSEKRYAVSSLLWAVAIFLKVFPAIIFLFLILRKQWKMAVMLTIACGFIFGICVAIQGPDVWRTYLFELLPRSSRGEITGTYVVNYQSAWMLLKVLFIPDPTLNPAPLLSSEVVFYTLHIGYTVLVLGFCASVIRKTDGLISFGTLLLGAQLISPYGSTYSCLLLVFVLMILPSERFRTVTIVVAVIALACNVPVHRFSEWPPPLNFPRLFLLLVLMITLFVLSQAKFNWKISVAFLTLFTAATLLQERDREADHSVLYPNIARRSLIFDYSASKGTLVYQHWSDDGPKTLDTGVPVTSISRNGISLVENQIQVGEKKLTAGPDRKLKPAIMNDTTIIYLSDKDRGPGFYALRMLRIPEADIVKTETTNNE